jgi:hypothetical protein
MLLLSVLAATAVLAADTGSLECKAVYRKTDPNTNKTVENVVNMPISFAAGGTIKYEADLEGRAFTLTEEKGTSLLGQITQGPDYTKGIVSRGTTDASDRFNLTDVDGFTIYRMECKKLPLVNPPKLDL